MITSQEVGQTKAIDVETRARQSQGISNSAIYEMVARAIAQRHCGGGVFVDVGYGAGNLRSFVSGESSDGISEAARRAGYCCDRYIDAVRYESKLTLVLKNQFSAFQEAPGLYPAHIRALLEIDLIRIAKECGLSDINTDYSNQGRIPFTPWHWPTKLGFRGRTFSDNICLLGRKP